MRKPIEDPLARTAVERQLGDLIAPSTDGEVGRLAKTVASNFPHIEYETVTRDVQGQQIHLRRPVLTGKWEIDPTIHLSQITEGAASRVPATDPGDLPRALGGEQA